MARPVLYITSSDYAVRTGGYVYNSRLVQVLREQGVDLETHCLEQGFPMVPEDERAALARRLAALPAHTLLLMDHVYLGRLLELFRQMPHPIVAIFHHSDVMEHGTGSDEKGRRLFEAERASLGRADALLVSSDETARYVQQQYGFSAHHIHAAVPGNDPVMRTAIGDYAANGGPRILSIGAVIPRKRYDYILDVASHLKTPGWTWNVAGDPSRYPGHLLRLQEKADALGLADRFHFLGNVGDTELEQLWHKTDLYVAASHYEGYGMAIAEALRHGVPVVSTASGAVSTWAKAGIMQAPAEDASRMADHIDHLFSTACALKDLGERAWNFGQTLPTWAASFHGMTAWLDGIHSIHAFGQGRAVNRD
ncbi:glycosyltransferase family 4 protein [Rhizobium sp. FKY42]|uniref:glycosyltransferase family 4 protein n=1 Tax=Rhizobium sp. FKY42 TaxID=2562310 RepID=UPI0010C1057F|nr:glycosyltransferase family 4 protein [Rhizobium sp. FKY42]